jgi:hypothetical protein
MLVKDPRAAPAQSPLAVMRAKPAEPAGRGRRVLAPRERAWQEALGRRARWQRALVAPLQRALVAR